MEVDVHLNTENHQNELKENKKSKTSHFRSIKLPLRASSEKHSYKRHTWLLPEGQTVIDKQHQLFQSKRKGSEITSQRIPQLSFYLDLCILLKNLFCHSSDKLEVSVQESPTIELQNSFSTRKKVIQRKEKKVDDLHELYVHQQHMREGATNLITTLESVKPSKASIKERIEECKLQRQQNIERLLSVEDELNRMAGALKFQILGLVGFSRLCPGDVYEISFKLATQKWKSKCKIETLGQTWVDSEFCFQAKAAFDLSVKMVEVVRLGSSVIGSVSCSVQEFLNPEPKVYLLPINTTGTMKLKLGVVWNALSINEDRELLNHPSLFPSINFSDSPIINLHSLQQPRYMSPVPQINGDHLNNSYPSQILEASLYNNNKDANGLGNSFNSSYSEPRYLGEPDYSFKRSASHYDYSRHNGIYDSNRTPLSHDPLIKKQNVIHELKRKTSKKIMPESRVQSGGNSSSFGNSGNYQSFGQEEVYSRRHSYDSSAQMLGAPPRKVSSTGFIGSFTENPQSEQVHNVIRAATVAIQPNVSTFASSPQDTNNNGDIGGVVLLRKKSLPDQNGRSPISNKSGPSIKPKPKPKRQSSLGPVIEDFMRDDKQALPKMIQLCEKIIQKLNTRKEIKERIPDLEKKISNIKRSLEQYNSSRQRKPSLTDSISSALASFAFLEQEHTFQSNPTTGPKLILPKQWKRSHRTLSHHLYMMYDAIDAFEPARGPLCEMQNIYNQCIHKQKFFIKEIFELISTPEDIELSKVCGKFTGSTTLTNTWEVSASDEQPLYCSAEAMLETFRVLYQHLEMEDGGDGTTVTDSQLKEKVCSQAMFELTEAKLYGTDCDVITLLQFIDFFTTKVKSHSVVGFLRNLRVEELALRALKSRDDLVVMSTLQQYTSIPALPSCIHYLLLLFENNKSSMKDLALNALIKLYEGDNRQLILNILLAAIEEKDMRLRAGACTVLGKCKVQTASQKLIYLYENDNLVVKEAAESALKDLGRTHIKR